MKVGVMPENMVERLVLAAGPAPMAAQPLPASDVAARCGMHPQHAVLVSRMGPRRRIGQQAAVKPR